MTCINQELTSLLKLKACAMEHTKSKRIDALFILKFLFKLETIYPAIVIGPEFLAIVLSCSFLIAGMSTFFEGKLHAMRSRQCLIFLLWWSALVAAISGFGAVLAYALDVQGGLNWQRDSWKVILGAKMIAVLFCLIFFVRVVAFAITSSIAKGAKPTK